MGYVTGITIRELRKKKNITQKDLADQLSVSDKTISKWETEKGLPDIGILEDLAKALGVSVAELLSGDVATNKNRSSNMRKTVFYICPICGNMICATGEGHFSCCGVTLPKAETEQEEKAEHEWSVQEIEGEYYVSMQHEMNKKHYISFFAYVTINQVQIIKMYPEQNPECRFLKRGHGILYGYCNRHGLFQKNI